MTSIALQQSLHSKKQSNNVATLTNRLRISSGRRSSSSSSTSSSTLQIKCEVSISFVRDLKETSVPLVKLTKSRDGTSGTAFFTFENPDIFEGSSGDITGMYLQDEEGEMQTVDVNAKFVNGKPKCIEARYIMRSSSEWERFMRFMTRYAEENGLGFQGN